MDLLEKAKIENSVLTEEITSLNEQLSVLPEGSLAVYKNSCNNSYKWFLNEIDKATGDRKRTYIPRAHREYAEALAKRTILSACLKDAIKKQSAISGFLRHYPKSNMAEQLLDRSPGLLELLEHSQTGADDLQKAWQEYPYEMNPFMPENKTIRTLRGEMVRSKAEAMIANTIVHHGIAYRYDSALYLGDSVVYPDFLMMRPGVPVPEPEHRFTERDRKRIIIVEHNGLMDKQGYRGHVKHKIGQYYDYGFIPSRNLIMTYESSEDPFDLNYFIRELEYYYS